MARLVYNDIEPYVLNWLENLMERGLIRRGELLRKGIQQVSPEEVSGSSFHAFAGVGTWDLALRMAGWGARPVWTGSCPCQPFSSAGLRKGIHDERHLWPQWRRLVQECRPAVIFGEQVASPDGRDWLDSVSTDLEALGYAVGSADMCAAGVGAPHIRQRLFWVAYSNLPGPPGRGGSEREGEREDQQAGPLRSIGSHWASPSWAVCSDGAVRPVEPGVQPLAYRPPARVGRLRAYGNAIVPQVAALFIKAFMQTQGKRQ